MLLILKAVIMGIVEGITEFLPISSTGHLILVGNAIGFKGDFADMFEVVIQLGAILAIVVLYWKKIKDSLKLDNLRSGKSGFKLWSNILVAFIPAALIGFVLEGKIKEKLFNPITVALALVVGGILMIFIENNYRKKGKTKSIDDVNIVQAFKVGLFQCLSLWPGMSRSASTIMGGWIGGMSTSAAAEFSFFLAIPVMVAASGLDLLKYILKSQLSSLHASELIALAVGFIVSFLVALFVVDKFIAFLKKKPMRVFAIYRIIVGVILLILAVAHVITL